MLLPGPCFWKNTKKANRANISEYVVYVEYVAGIRAGICSRPEHSTGNYVPYFVSVV